jgi:hypothetical protein
MRSIVHGDKENKPQGARSRCSVQRTPKCILRRLGVGDPIVLPDSRALSSPGSGMAPEGRDFLMHWGSDG